MQKVSILIIDDDFSTALLLQKMIDNYGTWDSDIATNAEQMWKILSSRKIDLIVMDIDLKDKLDGIELYNKLSRDYDVPVIYVTAFSEGSAIRRAKYTEPYGFLIKPIAFNHLITTIEIALYKFRMDRRVRKWSQQFEIVSNTISESIVIINQDSIIDDCNVMFAKRYHCEKNLLIGQNLWHYLPIDIHKIWQENLDKSRNKIHETKFLTTSKNEWDYVSIIPVIGLAQKIERFIIIIKDFTIRKNYEYTIQKSEQRSALFSQLLNTFKEIVLVVNRNGAIIYGNKALIDFTGYNEKELSKKRISHLLFFIDTETKVSDIVRKIKRNSFFIGRFTIYDKKGAPKTMEIHISNNYHRAKKIDLFFLRALDIS